MSAGPFRPVEEAIAAIARGEMVLVADDEDRENEGDLIFAADAATPEMLAFLIRYSSGVVCVALTGEDCDRLALPAMVEQNTESMRTAYTVSVDLRHGTSTGISAADRAATIRALADSATQPGDLARPGHVFPLRARPGGVLKRTGHTEASVDLARLAGRSPAGVLCEVVLDDGRMARVPDLARFAEEHGLVLVSIADLVRHRLRHERLVTRVADAAMPTEWGEFRAVAYESALDGNTHVAFVAGDPAATCAAGGDVLVRVHSECLTGDVFGSMRCDCGPQLHEAMRRVAGIGCGVVVYLRGHEGRGIGLGHKLRAYELQERGLDTVDANLALGLPVDGREYGTGAQILADLGATRLRLLTNNPAKYGGLAGFGLTVTGREALVIPANPHNEAYLRTKHERMGHLTDTDPSGEHAADTAGVAGA